MARLPTVSMQIVCALAVLVATLAMLGVPKDHGGPRQEHRLRALHKSHSCKRPAKNFGAPPARQSHSHNKPRKCDAASHGKRSPEGGEMSSVTQAKQHPKRKKKKEKKKSNESSRL